MGEKSLSEGSLPTNELPPVLIADSITRIGGEAAGAVVVNGSHGGIYAAYLAAKLRVCAAIFNDAGVGRDNAGIAGLGYLAALPAAERDQLYRERFDQIDANHDGKLDPEERAAWREKQREHYRQQSAERAGAAREQH